MAFVELRTGKAHRVEQPDTDRLVYLYVGSDGLPVGVKLLQPIPATLRAFLFGRLVAVTNGLPRSDRGGGYRLSPTPGDAFMDAAMSEVLRASTALERSPRMAPPPA